MNVARPGLSPEQWPSRFVPVKMPLTCEDRACLESCPCRLLIGAYRATRLMAVDLWHRRHIDGHRIRGPDYVSVNIIDHGDEGDVAAAIKRNPPAGSRLPWQDRGCEGPPESAGAAWVLVPDLDYEIYRWPLRRPLAPVNLPRSHGFAVHRRGRLDGDRRRGPRDWCAAGRDRAGRRWAAHRG